MKKRSFGMILGLALGLVAGGSAVFAQTSFKVPFKFQAGTAKCAAGDYTVVAVGDADFTLRQESSGKEVKVPFQKKLVQPDPPVAGPQLVFDEVGNFEPSYTEYFTVYVLAEVWLPGQDGLEVHVTKGAHKTKVVEGRPPAK